MIHCLVIRFCGCKEDWEACSGGFSFSKQADLATIEFNHETLRVGLGASANAKQGSISSRFAVAVGAADGSFPLALEVDLTPALAWMESQSQEKMHRLTLAACYLSTT